MTATHVFNFSYVYQLPKFFSASTLKGKIADGWAIQGITVLQSGQPYSIIDYTGAVGSIFYSVYDGITNPIVPLAPGCTPKNALTGASGAYANSNPRTPASTRSKQSCFTLPLLSPGDLGRRDSCRMTLSRPTSPPASATSSAKPGRGAPIFHL